MLRLNMATPIEWPTLILALLIYGGWFALTSFWTVLPWSLVGVLGSWLLAWHMSLQHEVIHGHPTQSRFINDAIGFPPLSLWLPYECYAQSHRAHHTEPGLTVPGEDPESFYFASDHWRDMPAPLRGLLRAANTFLGRLLLGPTIGVSRFLCSEWRQLWAGQNGRRSIWLRHFVSVAVILTWLSFVHIPIWQYLFLAVYPGYALALIRSFAEHQAEQDPAERTAIVENAPMFGLLFLYNNLHVVHHRWPRLPWYEIPKHYRVHRDELIAGNGGLVYDGYADVAARYWLLEHHAPQYPEFANRP